MSEREIPQTAYLDVDQEAECGREMPTDPPTVCGKAPVVWVAFDSHEDWDGYIATACDEHAAELLAFPGIRVSSDAPILAGEDGRLTNAEVAEMLPEDERSEFWRTQLDAYFATALGEDDPT